MNARVTVILLVIAACEMPAMEPTVPSEGMTVTVEEAQVVFLPIPPEECVLDFAIGVRSCLPFFGTLEGDLRTRARGALILEGLGRKDRYDAMHFTDDCRHYLCSIDDACAKQAFDAPSFWSCVRFTDCCITGLDR